MIKAKELLIYNKLFKRYHGWSGADGIFTLNYQDKIIWYFSDTFVGDADENDIRIKYDFINNSFALSSKAVKDISFIYQDNPIRSCLEAKNGYYWLEDGLIEGDDLYIYALNMCDSDDKDIPFAISRVDLLRINLTQNNFFKYETYPVTMIDNIILGTSVIKEDNYYYVFGYINACDKKLILSRTKDLTSNDYEFLDNDNQFSESTSNIRYLKSHFAAEFKFIKIGSSYYCAYTKHSIGKEIYLLKVDSLLGDYSKEILIYTCKEHQNNIITYNAKIQQGLSNSQRLIITYNVNSLVNDDLKNIDIYRPRFIEITMEDIENEF